MKFITTSISLSMITSSNYELSIDEINKEQFENETYDGYSCVGYQDIADKLNVAYNKEAVKARPGDELYVANLQQGTLKYYRIRVFEKPRLENKKLEEGMVEWF